MGANNFKRDTVIPHNGGLNDVFYKIRKTEHVPEEYRNHPNFESLSKDAAHGNKVVPGSLREAMAIIEAEKQGLILKPASRSAKPELDFYDAKGCPFDVKTPPSPPTDKRYPFDVQASGEAVVSQLQVKEKNLITGKEEPVSVLLDTTYLKPNDYKKMWKYIEENATKEELKRVFKVKVKFPEYEKMRYVLAGKIKNSIVDAKNGR